MSKEWASSGISPKAARPEAENDIPASHRARGSAIVRKMETAAAAAACLKSALAATEIALQRAP